MIRIFFLLLLVCSSVFANQVAIPDSMLTAQQKQFINSQKIYDSNKAMQESASGWIGIGRELGTAVDVSLKAISDRSNEFADTKVGSITLGLVIWKVVGKDAMGIISEVITDTLLLVLLTILLGGTIRYCHKNYINRPKTIQKTDKKGNLLEKVELERPDNDEKVGARIYQTLALCIWIISVIAILVH